MSVDDELRRLAERQHGVIAWHEGRQLGATWYQLRTRVRGPDWELATPRVLRLVGAPRTSEQLLMVAVLDGGPGTVVSHASAAALWRLPGFGYGPVETSRVRGAGGLMPSIGTLHRPRFLPEHHTTRLAGIPITTLPRTLFDLAARLRPARLERLIDTVTPRSPAVLRALHQLFPELAEHGRTGIAAVRVVLEQRPIGYLAPASGLERRFQRILANAGEPPMERQVDLGGFEWIGRVDFIDRALGLVVEVDSDAHHTSKLDREHDGRRDEAALAAGFGMVVRVTEDDVWRHPERAVAAVRRARTSLRGVLAPGSRGNRA